MPEASTWDVAVIGGGTAGVMAGIAAARQGARTLLVERSGVLGGNAATGMNLGGFFDGRKLQVVKGIPQEFVDRAVALGAGRGHVFFDDVDRWISSTASIDPEAFKRVAWEKIRDSGCALWLYTTVAGAVADAGKIRHVDVVTKTGMRAVSAKVFVDATGDADLAACVDVPYERGGGTRQQAVTAIFRLGQVEFAPFERFMQERINTEGKTPWTFENAPLRGSHKYWTPWKIFPEYASRFPRQFGVYYHGVPGEVFLNCNHTPLPSLEPDAITKSTVRLREQTDEILDFLRRHAPGFGRAQLTQTYDLGIRESRRIIGEYVLTAEDMVTGREFEDVVAMGAYPPDLHDAHGGEILIHGKGWSGVHAATGVPHNPGYQIPLRSLLPRRIENLLVVGRCLSASFEAQSGARGMGPCSAMGQAGGTAAALAARKGIPPREVPVPELQEALIAGGAYLGRQRVAR
jgi:hypothetical protein